MEHQDVKSFFKDEVFKHINVQKRLRVSAMYVIGGMFGPYTALIMLANGVDLGIVYVIIIPLAEASGLVMAMLTHTFHNIDHSQALSDGLRKFHAKEGRESQDKLDGKTKLAGELDDPQQDEVQYVLETMIKGGYKARKSAFSVIIQIVFLFFIPFILVEILLHFGIA